MLHPDYQYSPKLVPAMAAMVVSGEYDLVLGSRILGGQTRAGGMPLYKYVSNRGLTLIENFLLRSKLSEFHTGFRAFSREVLEALPFGQNADDFLFNNEILEQAIYFWLQYGGNILPHQVRARSLLYQLRPVGGLWHGVSWTAVKFRWQKLGIARFRLFEASDRGPSKEYYSEIN